MSDSNDQSPMYNGRTGSADDSILPDRLQKILPLLNERAAQRMRDWLTGYTISEIEEQLDYILGGDARDLPEHLRPPVNPGQQQQLSLPNPNEDELWDDAEKAVERIAKMYKILTDVGMSEETAVAIIADETNGIRMNGKTTSGFAQVPIAGARAMLHKRPAIPGLPETDSYGLAAGWPPRPIE